MRSRIRRRNSVIDKDQATLLLYPIAAFFKSGGLTRAQSLAALMAAYDYVLKFKRQGLEHIGASICYLDLIATWSRERRFLDSQGRPRALPMAGPNGFAALVRGTGTKQDTKKVLAVLIRYRNVRKLRDGRVQLISPLFRASAGSRIAFEPIAHFLNDASFTLTRILMNTSTSDPPLFWRTVESAHVPESDAGKFMEFAKERSLLFLEELDDWLQAHGRSKDHRSKKSLRVGLGLFSICSHGTQLSNRL